jgi:hypothetical protein
VSRCIQHVHHHDPVSAVDEVVRFVCRCRTRRDAADPTMYRTVGGVIDESPDPPMIMFVRLDSLPPQVGSAIPIAG